MFSPADRQALQERVFRLARADARVLAGALVGSLAGTTGGDAHSDLDLTFAVAPDHEPRDVLASLAAALERDADAIELVQLESGRAVYSVMLFPGALQLDLSAAPAIEFGPKDERFRPLFGAAADDAPRAPTASGLAPSLFIPTPAVPDALVGWGVIYALHARACIERSRSWQAEHYIGAVRDHALSLLCLRHGVTAVQARGYDDLPLPELERLGSSPLGDRAPAAQRQALAAGTRVLVEEAHAAGLPHAAALSVRLAPLASAA